MSTKKEQYIQEIMSNFQEMADLVLEQLNLIEKLMTRENEDKNGILIEKIKQNEKKIDHYEIMVSDKFINAIVLYQPVASDIRKLVAVYRMIINLERIGDLVMNISYTIDILIKTDEYKAMSEVIMNMLISGKMMVEKSLLSFVNSDPDYAIWTIKNDAIVDEMNQKLLKNSISKAKMSARTKEMLLSYADLKNIITNIERIADHATNIAEATIYSLQGTDIRHSGIEEDSAQPGK
jgi:phosphate transport system protein